MPSASGNLEARVKILERAVASQAELIASLRLRLEALERRQPDQRPPDLAGILAIRAGPAGESSSQSRIRVSGIGLIFAIS